MRSTTIQACSLRLLLVPLIFLCAIFACPRQGLAAYVEELGSGSNSNNINALVSGDGSTLFYGVGYEYHYRVNGVTADFAGLVAAVSQDGSVVAARTDSGCYAYTSGGYSHSVKLDDYSSVYGINPDGTAIVGEYTAFGGQMGRLWLSSDNWASAPTTITLGELAYDVSNLTADGKWVVVGDADSTLSTAFFIDSTNTALQQTVTLSGDSARARCITGDGTLAFGTSYTDHTQASVWNTSTGDVTPLPDNNTNSNIQAINSTGSAIVGYASFTEGQQAVYWTRSGTTYSLSKLKDTLEGKNVSLDGWNLTNAKSVSDDGNLITGIGTHSGNTVSYLANLGAGGLTTPDAIYDSLGAMGQIGPAVSSMGQLSMSRLGSVSGGQTMHMRVNAPGGTTGAPAKADGTSGLSSGDEQPGRLDLWMVGSVGSNIELNGDDLGLHGGIGLSWEHGEWRFGGGLFGDSRDLDTDYNGNQDIKAAGPGAFVAYSPEGTDLEFRASTLLQAVNLELKRGYANGGSYATSTGSTDARVFGLSGRVQWTRDVTDALALTPFAEYTWQHTHIDGYSESNGPFPASFDSTDEDSNAIRTGLRGDFALLDNIDTWAWGAWNHRFEDKSAGLGGSALGVGAFHYSGSRIDQDWADLGMGASWEVTDRLSATSSLGFALGCDDNSVPDLTATVGLNYQIW